MLTIPRLFLSQWPCALPVVAVAAIFLVTISGCRDKVGIPATEPGQSGEPAVAPVPVEHQSQAVLPDTAPQSQSNPEIQQAPDRSSGPTQRGEPSPKRIHPPHHEPLAAEEVTAVNEVPEAAKVREPALAGAWYEAQPEQLTATITGYLKAAQPPAFPGYPMALVVPHAGHRFSGPTAAHAYATLQGRTYERVFVIGPSHRAAYRGIALPDVTHYRSPLGLVEIDQPAVAALRASPLFTSQPGVDAKEHCIEIQLPFLQTVLPSFRLVPLLVSNLGREDIVSAAEALARIVGPGDLVVISTDFTHYGASYGYVGPPANPIAPSQAQAGLRELLDRAWGLVLARDLTAMAAYKRETGDTICGFLPLAILTQLLPKEARGQRLHSSMSAEIAGDWSNSVSYLSAIFTGLWPYHGPAGEAGLTPDEKTALLKLARFTLERQVRGGPRPTPNDAGITVTPRLLRPSGSFVTLKKEGDLRGCIGNIPPDKPLVEGIIDNATSAALHDSRFSPVSEQELGSIQVEVSVLTPPTTVDGPQNIVLGKHGILLRKGRAGAVFLPQVAPEQGWTLEQTLQRLSSKAHLPANAWKDGASFQLFEAIVFHEE